MTDPIPPFRTFLASDTDIRERLRECRTIAMIGLGVDPQHPSQTAARGLLEVGYRILPIDAQLTRWLDLPVFTSLDAIAERIDIVHLLEQADRVDEVAESAARRGARVLWLDREVVNAPAAWRAARRGLQVVMGRSLLAEYRMHFDDEELGFDE